MEKNNIQLFSNFKKAGRKNVPDIYFLFVSLLIVPIVIIALQFRGVDGQYFMITGATLWAILLIILVVVDISAKYSRKQPHVSEHKYEKLSPNCLSDRNYGSVRDISSMRRKARTQ